MPMNPKRRKRSGSTGESGNGVKKSKLAGGKPFVHSSERAKFSDGEEGSQDENVKGGMDFSDSEDDRLEGVGEEGIDLSELMDLDETADSEPEDGRASGDHSAMLRTLRTGLGLDHASQKRKAQEAGKNAMPARRENAFQVSAEGASKVDLGDLMAGATFSKEAKKGLEKLSRSERRLTVEGTKESKMRQERLVSYDDAKALLTEWLPTVQTMRQAESLVFPLPDHEAKKAPKASTSSTTTSFEPRSELERAVFGILEESGVTDAKLQQAEDLATKKLSEKELAARHQQIARLRSLFFYQEQKNKRQSKIKSKKYRKILKKAREKNELTLAELEELDPEAYKLELEKLDKARAMERVGIKHGHLGKWAKHALRSKDPHTMQAVRDHLEHGRALKKKMATDRDNSDESSGDEYDTDDEAREMAEDAAQDFEDEDGDGDIIDIHGNIVSKPKTRKSNSDPDAPTEGIFGMKFMQVAQAKRQSDHDGLMSQMDREIEQRKAKLKSQVRDDFKSDGLKADSDSDSDDKSTTKKAPKPSILDTDEMDPLEALTARTGGRRKIAASKTQLAAAATLTTRANEEEEDDGIGASSMVLDRPQGFSASIKGKFTVQAKKSAVTDSANGNDSGSDEEDNGEDGDDEEADVDDDGAMVFKPNSKNVKRAIAELAHQKPQEPTGPLSKKAQKRAAARERAKAAAASAATQTKTPTKKIDEDNVVIGSFSPSAIKKAKASASAMDVDDGEDETVIPVPQSTKGDEDENPWMTVNSDDEGMVIPGTHAPKTSGAAKKAGKKAIAKEAEDNPWMTVNSDDEGLVIPGTKTPSAAKKASVKTPEKKKKVVEDRVAVDLEKVQKKLKDEENRRGGVSFNLTAAGDASKAQRELIERAFAGDHVTESEILAEKEEAVEAANEVEEQYKTLTMPGWGEWAGTGTKPSARRKRILKEMEEKKKERSEELMAARRDAKLSHVVMTSKENKHFAMYQAASVPSEFRDHAELYEASLRQPMGKEWNIRETHGRLVKPKVVVRAGQAIEPIQKKSEGIQRAAAQS